MDIRKVYYTHGETLHIYINKIKERTLTIEIHRSCLISEYTNQKEGRYPSKENGIKEPLNLTIKVNGKVIFSDKLTNKDLDIQLYDCTTSQCQYTSKTPPKIEVLINDEVFSTYDTEDVKESFYGGGRLSMLFSAHGAG